ncbi:MAG: helix-turn-helix domain-containing protein [Bacilli bacterium]|nr:helix-turn-helix domain-containing protein [Bacilli bacterium]
MILADKIINLRKKAGMSQEELAYQLGVSRQAVSKWEGAQSIPDINKIIDMSALFGVSTDYLLKDEIEDVEYIQEDENTENTTLRKVTMEEANDYLNAVDKLRYRYSFGVSCMILSPVTLILFGGLSDAGIIPENIVALVGLVAMFVLVSLGIFLFLTAGFKSQKYNYLNSGAIDTEYGVSGMVKEKQKQYTDTYHTLLTISILMLVVSPVPLIVFGTLNNDIMCIASVALMITIAAIAVFMIVTTSMKFGSYKKLLREGEYSKASIQASKVGPIARAIIGSYWMIWVAIFLLISFLTNNWQKTWIIWPVAGVLYPVIVSIVRGISRNRIEKKEKENNE